jgi:hypothetical protein
MFKENIGIHWLIKNIGMDEKQKNRKQWSAKGIHRNYW